MRRFGRWDRAFRLRKQLSRFETLKLVIGRGFDDANFSAKLTMGDMP